MSSEHVVVDASALIDLLLGGSRAEAIGDRLDRTTLHAPAHLDAEVLSGLGRLHRAGRLNAAEVAEKLALQAAAPVDRHPVEPLIVPAWGRRHTLRLADALYVELADALAVALITTDARLGRATPLADVVTT